MAICQFMYILEPTIASISHIRFRKKKILLSIVFFVKRSGGSYVDAMTNCVENVRSSNNCSEDEGFEQYIKTYDYLAAIGYFCNYSAGNVTVHHENIPTFFTYKQGFEGVYLIFLFLIQNIHCGYSLEPPRRGGSNVYPQCMF